MFSEATDIENEIKKLSPIEHVLQNPDMYFGDIKVGTVNGYTYNIDKNTINTEKLIISNVLLKMFDEILMNASDNAIRSKRSKTPMTYIDINIDKDKKMISVSNNGMSIPIKQSKNGEETDKRFYPEIAFTELFSSSNFNNNRTGAGKNGVGASITNVMSKQFIINVICDNKEYKQIINNNCKEIGKPIIKDVNKENKVKISFYPDMKTILNISGSQENEDEIFNNTTYFMNKRILDINVLLSCENIKIIYNGQTLKNINLEDYAKLFIKNDSAKLLTFKEKNFELLLKRKQKNEQKIKISFINNIAVTSGVHLKKIYEQIEKAVMKQLKIKKDEAKVIKQNLIIFMRCKLINPMFEGQSKSILQKADNIGAIKLSKNQLEEILSEIDFNDIVFGKKVDIINKELKIQKSKKLIIDKLTDANFAGSARGSKCTLFLCEGDSAATLAKDGITCLGSDYFGVYPLGGKPINVREETTTKIQNNKTVMDLAKILGLPLRTTKQISDKTPLDMTKMRYGKIVMLKDADTDGAHIMGLVINMIEQLYPELLKIEGFFNEFITPMIKLIIPVNTFKKLNIATSNSAGTIISNEKNVIYPFYNTSDYKKFIIKYPMCETFKPIYIKGLGGHNRKETIEYFKNYVKNVVSLNMDKDSHEMLNIAFNKKLADSRKKILTERVGETALSRFVGEPVNCSEFIKNDWLDYSYDACVRAIPSCVDGLKPSQRKVLYVLLNNNYKPGKSNTEENATNFKKVFQICGDVAQKGYYHHGDQSLNNTIIGMARDYAGSNNLPLLAYSGAFGSRYMNGDDAAAPRYISATIHEIVRYIFPSSDDSLLISNVEDNTKVEPVYYIPIIPMILVNGAIGIGTGYSTRILQHHPMEIIKLVKEYIAAKDDPTLFDKTDGKQNFPPHYNYYKGEIKLNNNGDSYDVFGIWKITNRYNVKIKEVPFAVSKLDFINNLQKLYEEETIVEFKEDSSISINNFNFSVVFNPEKVDELGDDYLIKTLKLCDHLSLKNIVAFDRDEKIKRFNDELSIFKEWFEVRKDLYIRRKNKTEKQFEEDIKFISEKARFIEAVINNKIVLNLRIKTDIIKDLEEMSFMKIDNSYNYLLNLPISSLTKEKYEELINTLEELKKKFEEYSKLTIFDIWLSELTKLENYIKDNYDIKEW